MKKWLYGKLCKIPLFRDYLGHIRRRMEIYHQDTGNTVIDKTMNFCMVMVANTLMIFVVLYLFGESSLYYRCLVFCVIVMMHEKLVYQVFEKEETELLKQFEKYLTDVRFYYGFHKNVEESILEATENGKRQMGMHGEVVYRQLTNGKEQGGYKEKSPNPYFTTFYAICETVIQFGDKTIGQNSLFLKNLSYLKEEVNVELLKRQRITYLFSGLLGICIVPVFTLKLIELWAVGNISDMEVYYKESYGSITTFFIFLISIAAFYFVHRLRYDRKPLYKDRSLLSKMMSTSIFQKQAMKLIWHNYGFFMKKRERLKRLGWNADVMQFQIRQFLYGIAGSFLTSMLVLKLLNSKSGSPDGYLGLFISFILLAFLIGYVVPYGKLYMNQKICNLNREEEVIRFQSIILILMYMEQMSVEMILQWMEDFSNAFYNSIAKTVDDMEYQGNRALYELREKETFLPFVRLADGLIACDKVPIYEAFGEVESDRNYYLEKHKQENEQRTMDKSLIAKVVSFIPMFAVIILKLIVPFVLKGLAELSIYAGGI